MKIFVAGATGRVGRALTDSLLKKGHHVYAGSRTAEDLDETDNLTATNMDLHAPVEELETIVGDVDAIYFTAGSRSQDLLEVDAFGAVKMMEVAKRKGIRRFILLSAIFADQPELWADDPDIMSLHEYFVAKFFADKYLMTNYASDLDFTIAQAGALKEGPGDGKIDINANHNGEVNIENLAETLAEILEARNTFGTRLHVLNGNDTIADAVKNY